MFVDEATYTKEEKQKFKAEIEAFVLLTVWDNVIIVYDCREYLALFKRTVSLHEVFLQRLAAHPRLREDHNFHVFLEFDKEVSSSFEYILHLWNNWYAKIDFNNSVETISLPQRVFAHLIIQNIFSKYLFYRFLLIGLFYLFSHAITLFIFSYLYGTRTLERDWIR